MSYHNYNDIHIRKTSLEDSELGQTNARTHEYKETWALLILFKNGSHKVIAGVEDYGLCAANTDIFWFTKNGFKSFMPKDDIQYFGREADWGDYEEGD